MRNEGWNPSHAAPALKADSLPLGHLGIMYIVPQLKKNLIATQARVTTDFHGKILRL